MPKAFSITYGLDMDTEFASFWAWLHDVRNAMNGSADAGKPAMELVDEHREQLDRYLASQADPHASKQMLTLAIALVGFHYASNQKFLNGLRDHGLFEPSKPPSTFHTIVEPPLEGPEPPR